MNVVDCDSIVLDAALVRACQDILVSAVWTGEERALFRQNRVTTFTVVRCLMSDQILGTAVDAACLRKHLRANVCTVGSKLLEHIAANQELIPPKWQMSEEGRNRPTKLYAWADTLSDSAQKNVPYLVYDLDKKCWVRETRLIGIGSHFHPEEVTLELRIFGIGEAPPMPLRKEVEST
jgi:hypothetical protein